jgi:putative N6-adenine-specific DNA methylase
MKLPGQMRLKESRRVPLWNGPIECRLFRFDMTAGAGPGGRGAVPADTGPSGAPGA